MKFSARLADILREDLFTLVLWNMLFVLFCIPVITIGPALCALTHCTCYLVHNDVIIEKPSELFFHAFKGSLRQGILFGLPCTILTLVLGFGFFIYSQMLSSNIFYIPLTAISLLGLLFLWGILMHLFPEISDKTGHAGQLSSAAACALIRMKKTLIALIVSAAILVLQLLMFPVLIPITLSIGLVIPALCTAYAHTDPPENPRGF